MGFPAALFLVLMVLKLTGVIAWDWWVVFLPLWPEAAVDAVLLVVVAVKLLGVHRNNRRRRARIRSRHSA